MGRVGVMGGTFDPVHLGHLRAAEEFAERLGLSYVLLIPAAFPRHRPDAPVSPSEDRLEMVRLAVRGNPRLAASDLEIRRGGPSWTSDTLEELCPRLPGDTVYLGMGTDVFREFSSWHRPEVVAALAHLVVMTRPGSAAEDLLQRLPESLRSSYRREGALFRHRAGTTLSSIPVTALDISASRIREMAASGGSIRYLVPEPVREYIEAQGLYGAKSAGEGGRP